MKWNAPLSAQAVVEALHYAWDRRELARVVRVIINCSVDLEPEADELCGAIRLVSGRHPAPKGIVVRKHVWNDKPKDWWSLAFLFKDAK